MATQAKRLDTNVEGEFFVDSTCIDCDTCRWMAPAVFDRAGSHSRVHRQPEGPARAAAARALIACPTGSIGGGSKEELRLARAEFPRPIDAGDPACDVYDAGWHSEKSFGAASYLLRRPSERGGNLLVDSPRFNNALARRLEELGGVATMFLTHKDDVADHERFHERFGCRRVLHAADVTASTAHIELQIDGDQPVVLDDELTVLPVPGHTRGSACLLYRDSHLFSGDHLAWSPRLGHLYAFRSACWYDWEELKRSMHQLAGHDFGWVLPGHGRKARFEPERMRVEMQRCLTWLDATP